MKKESFKLSNGKEFILTEYSLGDFVEIEKKFGTVKLDETKIEPMLFWLWLAIRKEHKDIKLLDLYELIPASAIADGTLARAFTILAKLNDWDKQNEKNVKSPVVK